MDDPIERFLASRDPALMESVIEAIIYDIQAFCMHRVPKEDAADLRQEILVAIVKGSQKCRAVNRAGFFAWCYQIARFTIAQYFRRREREPQTHADFDQLRETAAQYGDGDPSAENAKRDALEAIEILKQLGRDCFEIVYSKHALGLGWKEVGEHFGITPDAARMRANECLKHYRKG